MAGKTQDRTFPMVSDRGTRIHRVRVWSSQEQPKQQVKPDRKGKS